MHRLALLALLLVGACARQAAAPQAVAPPGVTSALETSRPARPVTILVSIDGMRADYIGRGGTPSIDALAAVGVRATAMRPSFPSLTFPNHYTLVTGLRPDRHGIVNNTMEDPAIAGVRFSMANHDAVTDRRWWDAAEPAWVTAEKAGVRTAIMFWPGSEAAIGGVRPAHWLPFDAGLPDETRVDTLLGWLTGPDRPGLATLYFDTVDHAGHEFGPDAPETRAAVAAVDRQVGRLVAGLQAREIAANIVVVADHGMAAIAADRVIRLDTLAPAGSFRLVTAGAVAGIAEVPGQEAVLAAALLRPRPHMQCWRKGEIPARFHYGRNPRVPAIICLADVGWLILGSAPREPVRPGGMHGYDPAAAEMAAMFVAAGPAFRPAVIQPFDNVDVYPLVMRLAGLAPKPSDGTLAALRPGLR